MCRRSTAGCSSAGGRSSSGWRAGLSAPFGGLLIAEARKEVATPIAAGARQTVRVQPATGPRPTVMPSRTNAAAARPAASLSS